MNYAIETEHVSKQYGNVRALHRVNLRVKYGEIYGFLGLNSAGKTTAIRALLGMIRPSEGKVKVLDQVIGPHGGGPWAQVGHLVESPAAYPEISVRENLDIARRLHGIKNPKVVDDVMDKLSIASYADRKAGTLSSGNFQRLGLARALLHTPELLILDEPSNALDPAGIVEIRELLISLAREHGTTVFMSSHILTEVNLLADRIGIVHKGELIEELDASRLEELRSQRLMIEARDLAKAKEVLSGFQGLNMEDGKLVIKDPSALASPETIATLLVNAGHTTHSSCDCAGKFGRVFFEAYKMKNFTSALWVETLKMRRSKVPFFTALGFSIAPLVGGLFMIILKDPEAAKAMGLISVKAQLVAGVADWPTFFNILAQAVAVGGAILFAIITSWVFGREFSDRTAKELLALPTSREAIISAKFIVITIWTLSLCLFIFGLGLVVGNLVDIPGWSTELLRSAFVDVLGSAILTVALLPFVALIASAGRGYMPPFGWAILTVAFAQIAVITGWGDWFPWSVPALFSGAVGPRSEQLGTHSYVIVFLSSFIGLASTFYWWRNADQTK
jgi:ABC-2 type transport system ATP-binding protein